MEKELKEIDEAIANLWWGAEISDKAKLWWNDHYKEIIERELAEELVELTTDQPTINDLKRNEEESNA